MKRAQYSLMEEVFFEIGDRLKKRCFFVDTYRVMRYLGNLQNLEMAIFDDGICPCQLIELGKPSEWVRKQEKALQRKLKWGDKM